MDQFGRRGKVDDTCGGTGTYASDLWDYPGGIIHRKIIHEEITHGRVTRGGNIRGGIVHGGIIRELRVLVSRAFRKEKSRSSSRR